MFWQGHGLLGPHVDPTSLHVASCQADQRLPFTQPGPGHLVQSDSSRPTPKHVSVSFSDLPLLRAQPRLNSMAVDQLLPLSA